MNRVKRRTTLLVFFGIFLLYWAIVIYASFINAPGVGFELNNVWEMNGVWDLEESGGGAREVHLPERSVQGPYFTISAKVPEKLTDGDALFIRSTHQDVSVTVDHKNIYKYEFVPNAAVNGTMVLVQYLEVPLQKKYAGKDLEISYYDRVSSTTSLEKIYVGDKSSFIYLILRQNALTLLAGLVLLVFGVISITRFFGYSGIQALYTKALLYRGIAMIFFAGWFLFRSEAGQFIIGRADTAYDISYMSKMGLPIPCVLSIAYMEEKRYIRAAWIFNTVALILDIVIFVMLFTGIGNLYTLSFLFDFQLNAAAFFCVITIALIVLKNKEPFGKIKYMVYALGIVGITAILEMAGWYVYGPVGVFLPLGAIFFSVFVETRNSADSLSTIKKDIEYNAYKRSQKTLLASISHELRTPINAILGLDEMIMRESTEDKIRSYAHDIQSSGNILLSLVNDLLDYSKLESGKKELRPEEYETLTLLRDVLVVARTRAAEKKLLFLVHISPDIPVRLYGDDGALRQVLLNILSNAVKYTEKGQVDFTVECKKYGKHVDITFKVKDTGIGIKKGDISKVTVPFLRLDEKKNKSIPGTGLGMSITDNLLKLMNSTLHIESEYGVGSEFSFVVRQDIQDVTPIGPFEADFTMRGQDTPERTLLSCPDAKLLVVDDTALNLKVFRGLLKRSGAEIDTAEDGQKALELCAKEKYDIIFMDQRMPGMDGPETLTHIRKDSNVSINKETPVILLTANTSPGMVSEAINMGFNGYISKPIVPAQLEDAIRDYLPKNKIKDVAKPQEKNKEQHEQHETLAANGSGVELSGSAKQLNVSPQEKASVEEAVLLDRAASMAGLASAQGVSILGKLYVQTLRDFAEMGEHNASEIENAMINKDYDTYTIKVHSLKSSASIIGATKVAEDAKELEELGDMARDGEHDAMARIEAGTENLLKEYRKLLKNLSFVLSGSAGSEADDDAEYEEYDESTAAAGEGLEAVRPAITPEELDEAYKTMREMTESLDLDGILHVLSSLRDYDLPEDAVIKLKQIKEMARDINFQGIRELLKE